MYITGDSGTCLLCTSIPGHFGEVYFLNNQQIMIQQASRDCASSKEDLIHDSVSEKLNTEVNNCCPSGSDSSPIGIKSS